MSCQFYDRKSGGGDGRSPQWGQCRRTSPLLSPATGKSYMIEGVWPTVRDDDWCGEWKSQAGVRRIGDSIGAPLAPKSPVMPSTPRIAPLTTVASASAIGGALASTGMLAAGYASKLSAGD